MNSAYGAVETIVFGAIMSGHISARHYYLGCPGDVRFLLSSRQILPPISAADGQPFSSMQSPSYWKTDYLNSLLIASNVQGVVFEPLQEVANHGTIDPN